MSAVSLREQQPALEALAELACTCPGLPGAHLSTDQHEPGKVVVQLDSQDAFEAWREALMVPTQSVALTTYRSQPGAGSLEFRTSVVGAPIRVWLAMSHLPFAVAS